MSRVLPSCAILALLAGLYFASGLVLRQPLVVDAAVLKVGPSSLDATYGASIKSLWSGDCGPIQASWKKGSGRQQQSIEIIRTKPCVPATTPQCPIRVIMGKHFLDDGPKRRGSMTDVARVVLQRKLAGFDEWPVGKFKRVRYVSLRWTGKKHPRLRIKARLVFQRVDIVASTYLRPKSRGKSVSVKGEVELTLKFRKDWQQWLADLVKADSILQWFVSDQMEGLLKQSWGPLPPMDIPGGGQLAFTLCPEKPFAVGENGEMIVAMSLDSDYSGPWLKQRPAPASASDITMQIDADGVNALLYELHKQGVLHRELSQLDLEKKFAALPIVSNLLSVRPKDIRLSMAPFVAPQGSSRWAIYVTSAVFLVDGDHEAPAVANLRLQLDTASNTSSIGETSVQSFSLACHQNDYLTPCYIGLVRQARQYYKPVGEQITAELEKWLSRMAHGKSVGVPGLARYKLDRMDIQTDQTSAVIELAGQLKVQ